MCMCVVQNLLKPELTEENHLIDWEETKIIGIDSKSSTRKVREAIPIRKRDTKALNRDDGLHSLDHVYNPLLFRTQLPGDDATASGADIHGKRGAKHF